MTQAVAQPRRLQPSDLSQPDRRGSFARERQPARRNGSGLRDGDHPRPRWASARGSCDRVHEAGHVRKDRDPASKAPGPSRRNPLS